MAPNMPDSTALGAMRACIQKIATGPELSKDLSREEARAGMRTILEGRVDPVQAAVFLIALRMKRETDDENRGVLRALLDATDTTPAPVEELIDVADPYDGYTRTLPASPFLPAVLAACGVPAVSHGVDALGPKYGVTHRKVLAAAGVDVDRTPAEAARRLADPERGWAYVDQRAFCAPLHDLLGLRTLIIKRTCLTTTEVLLGPIRAQRRTHLVTGYVHKTYPQVYARLAREAGFDSALIVRGVEGGVIPSLQQPAKVFYYHDRGEERQMFTDPTGLGIDQPVRAVPLPGDLPPAPTGGDRVATAFDAAEAGLAALAGHPGPTRDSLVYSAAICLQHLGRHATLAQAAQAVMESLDSGAARARFME
ncbi:MAG TPA: anthranilate phosphoribosyltransferase [Chromatiales bacterium]|nr:anthranilate phosphoribosyltransferase [Chromatiales bacterium]